MHVLILYIARLFQLSDLRVDKVNRAGGIHTNMAHVYSPLLVECRSPLAREGSEYELVPDLFSTRTSYALTLHRHCA
jgi:hypothetical protein